MHYRRITVTALLTTALLLAGFGCKPILDAQQRTQAKLQDTSIWVKEDPVFRFVGNPDSTGKIYLSVKSQPNATVTADLEGPGVVRDNAQRLDVGPDGTVEFEWPYDRLGRYTYTGTIIFNRIVEDNFDGYGDVY